MSLESIYKLSLIMSMVDNLTGPMSHAQSSVGSSITKLEGMQHSMSNAMAQSEVSINGSMSKLKGSSRTFGDMLRASLFSDVIMGGVRALGNAISGVGNAFKTAMKDGVAYNAQMESYTTSFTTMLGSQAKAQQLVNDLKKEAAATPFAMSDLASSMQTLMGFGMSVQDAQKHMKELGDISQGNSERFKSLSLAFAQVSSAGKLAGQDLLQMINAGFNPLTEISKMTGWSIANLKKEMEKGSISAEMVAAAMEHATSAGGMFYGAMEAQSKTFSGQVSTLKDNIASLKGQVATGLSNLLAGTALPMVNGWIGELSGAFEKNGAQGLIDAFGGIVQKAIAFASDRLPMFVDLASKIIISLVRGLVSALPKITEAGVQLLMTLVKGIIDLLPDLVDAGVKMIVTIISGIAQALPQLIPTAVTVIIEIVKTLLENLPMILDAAIQLIMALSQGLLNALPILIAALPDIINGIIVFLIDAIPQLIDAGFALLTAVIGALPEIINAIVTALPKIINGIINGLLSAIPQLIDAGIKLLLSLIQDLPKIITTIVAALPRIISGIVDGLLSHLPEIIMAGVQLLIAIISNIPEIVKQIVLHLPEIVIGIAQGIAQLVYMMADAGKNLIVGLWNGIKDAASWLWEQIKGLFNGIVDGIKNFLGIHSPSTVFADIGGNMGAGVGIGFKGAMKNVAKDMQNAIPTSFDVAPVLNIADYMQPGAFVQNIGQALEPPFDAAPKGSSPIDISAGREPVKKVDLKEVFSSKETSEKTTEKSQGLTINHLHLNIDLSKIKDLKLLEALLRDIENLNNGNSSVDPEEESA